jgi:SagB-type dehydrogenase family enzyme
MLDWIDFQPILIVPATPSQKGIRFLRQDKQLDIDEGMAGTVWAILAQCNGHRKLADISELSGIDIKTSKEILSDLFELNVLIDSREQYMHFHRVSGNPAIYLRQLTHEQVKEHEMSPRKSIKAGAIVKFTTDTNNKLFGLQAARSSCRSFSDGKLTLDQIGNICNYAYNLNRHAVPSGGNLYPLKIYVVVTREQNGVSQGYYEYNAEANHLVRFQKQPDNEQLKYCYNDETLAFNSPVQIIIAADLGRQPYKYSNRGYRLTLLEAGHAAQNICLYCAEQGIATCELGGLLDEALRFELNIIDDDIYPLLGMAVGKASIEKLFDYSGFLKELEDCFVGKDKPVKSYGVSSFKTGDASFFGAYAVYSDCGHQSAGATASSYYFAACKAIVEGYERYRSGQARVDSIESGKGKEHLMISPKILAPLNDEQAITHGLCPYNEQAINWTACQKETKEVYLPTDLVYYGHQSDLPKLYYGDSSGVAAFSNYEEAEKRALIELIERDALMRKWYEQKAPKHIEYASLPIHAQRKVDYWGSNARNIYVLDMGSPYLPVFQVVIVSENYPCFVSGAAAGEDSSAILKALQEAEYNLLLAIKYPVTSPPKLDEVKTPEHHSHFYQFSVNTEKIKWLWSGSKTFNLPERKHTIEELKRMLDVICVDLSEKGSPIKVVRIFSSKLIPISFGYGLDYYTHPEVSKLNYNPKSREFPHYFA